MSIKKCRESIEEAVCREREAVWVQGPEGEVSPWPGGVVGMLLGELQMMASSSTRAGWGGESPKRHSNSSSLVMLGRGLTDRRTCMRRTAQTMIPIPVSHTAQSWWEKEGKARLL